MAKRFVLAMAAFISLIFGIFLIYSYSMTNEAEPGKSAAEKLAGASDLEAFGAVEGAYLYTPKNYGFFNESAIYVVERNLGDSQNYDDKYVVIEAGEVLTEEERDSLKQKWAAEEFPNKYEIDSRHRIQVVEAGEVTREEWVYKVLFDVDGETYLSFRPAEGEERFNLSAAGYEQFRDF